MNNTIRQKILAILDAHRIMTIATLRPDGWPQATTVGYANEGLTLYFLCGLLMARYPEQDSSELPAMPAPSDIRIFRVTPTVISVLDYSKGFGHTDLVSC